MSRFTKVFEFHQLKKFSLCAEILSMDDGVYFMPSFGQYDLVKEVLNVASKAF